MQKLDITFASWVRAGIVLALGYALFLISDLILALITSVVIASAIEPVAVWAKRKNIPRLPAVVSVFILSAVGLVALFYFLILPLAGEISGLIRTLTIYFNSVSDGGLLSDMFKTQNVFGGFDTPAIVKELSTYLNSLTTLLSQGIFSSLSLIFGGIFNFILILVLSFYLVAQDDGISKFLKAIVPLKHEEYAVGLWRRSQRKIGLWMQGQLVASALVMLLVYVGLLIAGVPNALLLAVLAGVFELVPFGSIVAAIPAVFIAYVTGDLTLALIVVGIYVVVQQLEGHLIYPMIMKKVVGVSPMISIAALVVGGMLAGFLGVLIAVPVAAAIMELVSDLEARKVSQVTAKTGTPS
ncbi:MAG: AI-2E family transporter [Minisyncoccia bacterium]